MPEDCSKMVPVRLVQFPFWCVRVLIELIFKFNLCYYGEMITAN